MTQTLNTEPSTSEDKSNLKEYGKRKKLKNDNCFIPENDQSYPLPQPKLVIDSGNM